MMALSLFSFMLLAGGVAGYVSTIPGLLYKPSEAPLVPLALALEASGSTSGSGALFIADGSGSAAGPVAAQNAANGQDVTSAALGLGTSGSGLGATALAVGSSAISGSGVDSSFTKAVEGSEKNAAADSGSAAGSNASGNGASSGGETTSGGSNSGSGGSSSGSSGGSSGGSLQPSEPEPSPSGLSEEEEAQIHEVLVNHMGRVNTYITRLNAAITAFENDSMYGSHELRSRDYGTCAAIDSQTLTDFLSLRNFNCPEQSRWNEQKGYLQAAYIAIDSYLTVYYDAWVSNLNYDEPADYVDVWMEPVRADLEAGGGTSAKAARLNEILSYISL